jgi:DNA-binding transcriptional LysR family regulator
VRLFREAIVPVAHPSLGLKAARAAEAIPRHVLLEFEHLQRPWLGWTARLAAMGLPQLKPKAMLHFNQYDQVIHAALAGQGIALGRRALVQPMIDDGRLDALPWGEGGDDGPYSYWLITAAEQPRKAVAAVVRWILDEAGCATAVAQGLDRP